MKHSSSFLLRDWGHRTHDLSNDLFLAIISDPWTDIELLSQFSREILTTWGPFAVFLAGAEDFQIAIPGCTVHK